MQFLLSLILRGRYDIGPLHPHALNWGIKISPLHAVANPIWSFMFAVSKHPKNNWY